MSIAVLDADRFRPFVGASFTLTNESGSSRVRLDRIVEHPASTMPGSARTAFSLFFSAPERETCRIESGHFTIEHADLKAIAGVYIERVLGSRPDEIRLEAAFN
ncbi:DUF6916 family protein [Allorhizobium undicola]|uniref:DUF6916 family protein n=1 Tax=Allorhizobium undicola TaxID=78527 RepID=UPI00048322FF|nr:hypothetical protein [Allorhizobium undicola]